MPHLVPAVRPLKTVMLERLVASGAWMTRQDLAQGASCSPWAIDDALADLVLEHKAVYRAGVGYRWEMDRPKRSTFSTKAAHSPRGVCADSYQSGSKG